MSDSRPKNTHVMESAAVHVGRCENVDANESAAVHAVRCKNVDGNEAAAVHGSGCAKAEEPASVHVSGSEDLQASGSVAVHVYDIDLNRHYGEIEPLRSVLSNYERARAVRFVTERLQHDYIVSHGVTRLVLSRYVECSPEQIVFVQGEHGKPALDPCHASPMRFNLSHSGNKCLIAVTNAREVGVDVEKIRPLEDWLEIAKRFFSDQETEQLLRLPEALRRDGFFATWSRKEAYIKAIGMGLALELGSFAVEADPREQARLLWTRDDAEEPAHWEMRTLRVDTGYHAALAVRGPIDVVELGL